MMNQIKLDIADYIKAFQFEEPTVEAVYESKDLITKLVNGSLTEKEKQKIVAEGNCIAFAKPTATMSDAELLIAVLQRCDDSVLAKLEEEFKAQSRLSALIKQYRHGHQKISMHDDNTIMSIAKMLEESEQSDNILYKHICMLMEKKGYQTDSEFYNAISMSRQSFARIRNKSKSIGKHTILWIIVGLRLDYYEAVQLMETAGYAFKCTDKRDMIISYILKNVSDYTLDSVNDILYDFHVKTLCEDNL